MAYVPSSAAQATATLAGTNQAGLASPLTALQKSIAAGNLAPAALLDALLSSVGYQGQNTQTAGANSQSTGTPANVWSAYSFTAALAKTYLVNVDLIAGLSAITSAVVNVFFQLVVNGSTVALNPSFVDMLSTAPYYGFSARVPVAMIAGANTIQLQWWVTGTGTVVNNGLSTLTFTVTG